jgi:hypothetical protein
VTPSRSLRRWTRRHAPPRRPQSRGHPRHSGLPQRSLVASLVYLEPDLTCPHLATDPLARFQHRDAHTFIGEPPRRREACDAVHHHDMLAVRVASTAAAREQRRRRERAGAQRELAAGERRHGSEAMPARIASRTGRICWPIRHLRRAGTRRRLWRRVLSSRSRRGEPEQADRDAHAALAIAAEVKAHLRIPHIIECLAGLAVAASFRPRRRAGPLRDDRRRRSPRSHAGWHPRRLAEIAR